MASTNQTTHYGLPQYIGTDQAEWTDTNTPFAEVDSDLYTAKQNADSALAGIDDVALELNDLKVSVLGLQSSILGLRTDVNFNTANITNAMNDIDALEIDVAKLKLDVTDLVVSELPKKIDTFSGVVEDEQQTSYTAVTADGIAYDETNNQLLLKVDGADTVIPFSRGGSYVTRNKRVEIDISRATVLAYDVIDLTTGTTTHYTDSIQLDTPTDYLVDGANGFRYSATRSETDYIVTLAILAGSAPINVVGGYSGGDPVVSGTLNNVIPAGDTLALPNFVGTNATSTGDLDVNCTFAF